MKLTLTYIPSKIVSNIHTMHLGFINNNGKNELFNFHRHEANEIFEMVDQICVESFGDMSRTVWYRQHRDTFYTFTDKSDAIMFKMSVENVELEST